MIKFKKLLCFFVVAVACLGISFSFAACGGNEEPGETKYDVAIRVECSDGNMYEFPVGTDELHIEIPYTGMERTYWVDSYNLPEHPRWGNEWFSPSGEGANVFIINRLYTDEAGNQSHPEVVFERGSYVYTFMADSTSDLWNFRACRLFITLK